MVTEGSDFEVTLIVAVTGDNDFPFQIAINCSDDTANCEYMIDNATVTIRYTYIKYYKSSIMHVHRHTYTHTRRHTQTHKAYMCTCASVDILLIFKSVFTPDVCTYGPRIHKQSMHYIFPTLTVPSDFVRGGPTVLTVPARSRTVSYPVAIVDNALIEPTEEFTCTLSVPEDSQNLSVSVCMATPTVITKIIDNDGKYSVVF